MVFLRFITVMLFFAKLEFVLCVVDRGLCIGLPAAGDWVGIDCKPAEVHPGLITRWFSGSNPTHQAKNLLAVLSLHYHTDTSTLNPVPLLSI